MNLDDLLNSPQFKQALFDVQTAECERYEKNLKPVTFSPEFERKMERLIRAHQKPYYSLISTRPKRILLSFAAALILLTATVFSVSALREPVIRFIVEVYEKFSNVFFHQELEVQFPTTLETYYTPTWLPDGYNKDARIVDVAFFCDWTYENEDGGEIKFKQYTITSSVLRIDTEDVQTKSYSINGKEGLYYSSKGIQHLAWSDGQYGFLVLGPISEADLLRIAESIQPAK
ncbi:MAG: DUF4367 domain-containing protein [Firmicutes bacterium]|nr:DUF4367 domain-containing protein [Bacillota bacterium]